MRSGSRTLSIPQWRLEEFQPFDYITCVSRWPHRNRFERYTRRLRDPLPIVNIPLAEGDPDVALELDAAVRHAYEAGRYRRRIRYDEPCDPHLSDIDQEWAKSTIVAAG